MKRRKSLLRLHEGEAKPLEERRSEGIKPGGKFMDVLADKEKLVEYLRTMSGGYSGIFQKFPELSPPIDWAAFSAQVSAVIETVSQSGGFDDKGPHVKFDVKQLMSMFMLM